MAKPTRARAATTSTRATSTRHHRDLKKDHRRPRQLAVAGVGGDVPIVEDSILPRRL